MIPRTIEILLVVSIITNPVTALADCNDVKESCARNYELDSQACERNYSGEQQTECHQRAAQQLSYCVSSGGCS